MRVAVGVHRHRGPVDRPGAGLAPSRSACQARRGQTGSDARRGDPRSRPPRGERGKRSGASCPPTPVVEAPQLGAVRVGQARDRAADRLVQGAGRPGRGVGHARGRSRAGRGRLVGREPRAGSGLRRIQAGGAGDGGRAPTGASAAKVSALRQFDVRLVLHGEGYSEAEAHALELAADEGSRYVSPYNDPDVIAGQSTLARELLEQVPGLGTVVVPCGGGGLLAGVILGLEGTRRPGHRRRVGGVAVDERRAGCGVASSRSRSNRRWPTAWPGTSSRAR